MLDEILDKRKVPALLERDEMLNLLLKEEYGYLPSKPQEISWIITENIIHDFCAGKATLSKVEMICKLDGGDFVFPFYCALPTSVGKYPFFVHINFRDCVPDIYMPSEELIDNGFAVFSFCYEDVTKDNADFTDGLAGVLYNDGAREVNQAGKIAMWAWAAQRVMDYAETLSDMLDFDRAIVCGHSRLAKTALLAAATDERFKFVYSNESGCSGAAITRGKEGERVKNISTMFPFWFCDNYKKYAEKEEEMPFDQHYLIASIAPRYVCVGSAEEDIWADPASEMLGCYAAGKAYEERGMTGFVSENRLPKAGDVFFEGSIGYHLRAGKHYFSREDWLKLIKFVNSKKEG